VNPAKPVKPVKPAAKPANVDDLVRVGESATGRRRSARFYELGQWGVTFAAILVATALACGTKTTRPPATQYPSAPQDEAPLPEPEPQPERTEPDLTRLDAGDDIRSMSLEDINAQGPLADIQFDYDSAHLSNDTRARLDVNAKWLLDHSSVTILIEGHCDERGTVEYNLALGERRATATHNFLLNIGVPSARMKTISYGKEFPVDPGHNETAWAKNRRGHFVITSK
jgi:peptidoglycan-associated lipoprotein